MNIYFWKEVINHFQRVSTQIIRYINLIFTCLVTVIVARFDFFFFPFSFKSSVFLPTDWRLVAKCCTMNVSKSGQKYMIGYTCFSNSNMRRGRDVMTCCRVQENATWSRLVVKYGNKKCKNKKIVCMKVKLI